jgi:TonB family protein
VIRSAAAFAAAGLAFATPALAGPVIPIPLVDYPAGIVAKGEEVVMAAFTSGPGGVTTQCRIVQRSHVPALDDATCSILRSRARFAPGGEQRILFRWLGQPEKDTLPSRAERGDPLIVFPPGNISNDDYPIEALRGGESGSVGYDIDVTAIGRPVACRIGRSSGSTALDSTTCSLLVRRAIFLPAVDGKGRPVAGTYRGWLTWRM